MQKKSCDFNKYLRLGGPLNFNISLSVGEILGKFSEIMGNYSMLHENRWGLKGYSELVETAVVLSKRSFSSQYT